VIHREVGRFLSEATQIQREYSQLNVDTIFFRGSFKMNMHIEWQSQSPSVKAMEIRVERHAAPPAPQAELLEPRPLLSWNHVAIDKQPFSAEEDRVIRDYIQVNGARNWNLIAAQLRTRTPKQCRERWHNHLDPAIDRGQWTEEEDRILADRQAQFGNRWAEIARYLPGRTDTLVKNRWNTWVKLNGPSRSNSSTVSLTETMSTDSRSDSEAQIREMRPVVSDEFWAWLDNFPPKKPLFPSSPSEISLPPLESRINEKKK
jgi:hypothetical protein